MKGHITELGKHKQIEHWCIFCGAERMQEISGFGAKENPHATIRCQTCGNSVTSGGTYESIEKAMDGIVKELDDFIVRERRTLEPMV